MIGTIINHIYDAACDKGAWSVVLREIAALTHSKSVVLLSLDNNISNANCFFSYGDSSWLELYNLKYGVKTSSLMMLAGASEGELTTGHLSSKEGILYGSEVGKDICHLAGAWLIKNKHQSALIGLKRSHESPEYEREILALTRLLIPHLQKALHIHRLYSEETFKRKVLCAGINTMQTGVIFFDHKAEISYCNEAAETIINQQPAIKIKYNKIRLSSKKDDKELGAAIRKASLAGLNESFTEPVALGLRHPDVTCPLPVLIAPIHQSNFSPNISKDNAAAVMTITDPERMLITSPMMLATIYNLTTAEAVVAIGLANALSAKEIAEVNGIKISTIRTQIQSIFSKMGVQTQAQLIKLILTSPIAISQ